MRRSLLVSLRMALVSALLFGVLYPVTVWALSSVVFPRQASGSLVWVGDRVVGSRLVGQAFESDKYFHGRPSAAGRGYDAMASGATNLGPTSAELVARTATRVERLRTAGAADAVPVDLVTASASGLDPHISPDAAHLQVQRVAAARGIDETDLNRLVDEHVVGRQLGVLGEPRVSVLELNLALDEMARPR